MFLAYPVFRADWWRWPAGDDAFDAGDAGYVENIVASLLIFLHSGMTRWALPYFPTFRN